jgi:ribonuclease III
MSPAGELSERLAEVLGHRFERAELLLEALTHSSAALQRTHDYKRLEFLGDRVLGLVVAEMLWRHYPKEAEGALTRRLAELVRRETLAEVCDEAGLGPHIRLSAGERRSGTRTSRRLRADVTEAVIGALYLDAGLVGARGFVEKYWAQRVKAEPRPPKDPKTALQEWAQQQGVGLPRYETVGVEGPDHRRTYKVVANVAGHDPAEGVGSSKRAAEVNAAATLLARLIEAKA